MESEPANELPHVVSVLVPLYNHDGTIDDALDSVLLSNCDLIELIVSDDASTDQSAERAETWIGRHGHRFRSATFIRQQANLGITANLNGLIAMAHGEFVTLLASDDKLTTHAIDVQRRYLELHEDEDFVFANVASMDWQGIVSDECFVRSRRAMALQRRTCAIVDIVMNWGFPWPRLFARRSAFRSLGPYISHHSYEDRWSALKIAQTRRFGYLDRVVHLYRVRTVGTGTAGLDPERMTADMQDIERRLMAETTGLLRFLLWIRCRSFRTGSRETLRRLLWVGVRRAIERMHRLAIH
jgi:glycosyltransferase involved in cell wall biosynthesis